MTHNMQAKAETPSGQQSALDYRHADSFLHCSRCLKDFYEGAFGDGKSPHEALHYEVSGYPLHIEEGLERIVVVWCKRCGRSVWDSRHLRPR